MKKVANRRGSNIQLYDYDTKALYMYIPFARITAPEVTSDRVWARGGQSDANMVPFDEPMTGTLTITTQIIPIEVIALAASKDGAQTGADWAVREKITASEAGKLTLAATPVEGTVYVYTEANDATGEPIVGTVTGTTFSATDIAANSTYVAYYIKSEATAKHVTFSNANTPGAFVVYTETEYKDASGTIEAEQTKYFKAVPQKRFSLSYQGSGDPVSMDLVFDLLEDDDGNVIDVARL